MERSRQLIYILWPSFLMAAAADGLFFSMVAPTDLNLFGETFALSEQAAYSLGFFGFWLLAAASSGLTWFLLRSPAEVNGRCRIAVASGQADGCVRRADAGSCE